MMKKILFCISITLLWHILPLHAQNGGWVSLFNGKTLDGWKQMGGKAKYAVEKGAIAGTTVPATPNSFLVTEKEYGDFVLELEVKLPDSATNSGIQLRSHFNPNANDGKGRVFGYQYELDGSARAWTAGIYDEGRRGWLYPLDLNPAAKKAFRQGQYNKVKVECIGNTIKTWINNIPAAYLVDEADASGFIALQVHGIGNSRKPGETIHWRNIRIKTAGITPSAFPAGIYVKNNVPNQLTDYEKANGWKLLFNGNSGEGWRSAKTTTFPDHGWEIKDGALTVLSSHGNESARGGDIITENRYSAFDLSFDFRLTPGANSGLKYFVTLSDGSTGSALGLEYQVLDDKLHPDAKMGRDGDRTLASLYDLMAAHKPGNAVHAIGEWNTGRIIVYPDNHVEHYLNGQKVLEYERGSAAFRQLIAISKYKNYENFGLGKEGFILLQDHGDNVSYRSIKIKVSE